MRKPIPGILIAAVALMLAASLILLSSATGITGVCRLILLCLTAGSLIILTALCMIGRTNARRIRKLKDHFREIAATSELSDPVLDTGSDEIAKLCNSAELALREIDVKLQNEKVVRERYDLIMEATQDCFFDISLRRREAYMDPEWQKRLGIETSDTKKLLRSFYGCIGSEYRGRVMKRLIGYLRSGVGTFNMDYRLDTDSGTIWVNHRGKVVEWGRNGRPLRFVSVLADITKRKSDENEIFFLSYSDKLTGLKNRSYMEKKFEEIDRHKIQSYSIIMGDLNGLKLTNDAFGHREGDRLLYSIAHIISDCCSESDIAARWGGDEFIILMPGKGENYVEEFIKKIHSSCERESGSTLKFSIALGGASSGGSYKTTDELMSLAEERMYRNKLLEHRSVRNSTIISLETSLFEKDSETEEHTVRLSNMSKQLGAKLGLSQEKLDELELLGLLHDIGKIGIPEQILSKRGNLTEDEWKVMKQHAEIGYRIATSIPELAHIGYAILCHHEKYDGTGYPQGLKGEEIPLLSRIINIVDSFDAMTHARCYKDANGIRRAKEELIQCSGRQFDPALVNVFLNLLESGSIQLDLNDDQMVK